MKGFFSVKPRILKRLQQTASTWRLSAAVDAHTAPLVADESFFGCLVQNANSIILVSEIGSGRILFANRFALDFFGFTEKELLGKPAVGTIIPREDSSGRNLEAMVAGLYRHPDMYITNENENLRKDGERVWVTWTNRALLDAEGNFVGLLSVGNDITDRKRAEEERRRSEEYYRTIFNRASDAILVTDLQDHIIDANEAAARMYGCTRAELLAMDPWELVAPEAQAGRQSRRESYLASPYTVTEAMQRRKNGEIFQAEDRSQHIEHAGQPAVLHVVRDITAQKSAEEALRRSESYYRMVFEHSSDPVFLLDPLNIILDVNPAAISIYGYSREEFIGMDASRLVAPEHAPLIVERRTQLLERGFLSYENVHLTKDGRRLFLGIRASRVVFEGRPVMLVVAHDVTEQHERSRQMSEFLSIASHELSLPVTIIKGYAQTLSRHLADLSGEALGEMLGSIEASANRLNALVSELLDVTRIETGRLSIRKERIELEPLVLDTVKEMQFKADQHRFDVRFFAGVLPIEGDPDRIGQVLMILLDNAARFSPEGSLVEIETEASAGGPGVTISVLDRGIGVQEPDRERIFEPFSQVEDAEHHGQSGLGIGLYIAREIVLAHAGSIWCEERPGGGSAFRFSLPAF